MKTAARILLFAIPILTVAASPQLAFADLAVVTWNINGGQKSPEALRESVRDFRSELGTFDVLVLQEVVSSDQVAAIADELGMDNWAISDLSPPVGITGKWFRSLEIAIVTTLPIEGAYEWDTTGRELNGDGYLPRVSPEGTPADEIQLTVDYTGDEPRRGFLRVDLADDWTIYGVHWKSSSGASCDPEDMGNATQREDQASGVVIDATRALNEGRTVVVAGDFNIQAPGTVARSGFDPEDDPQSSDPVICDLGVIDGYDDSIQILSEMDSSFRLLSTDLPATYVGGNFADHAIDHIAVAGPRADTFEIAAAPTTSEDNYLGSDHLPVFTRPTATTIEEIAENFELVEMLALEVRALGTAQATGAPTDTETERLRARIAELRRALDDLEGTINHTR